MLVDSTSDADALSMQALIRQETRVSEESAEKVSEENADRHGLHDSFNLVVALA